MQNESTLDREGVVIDVAPEHEAPPAPAEPPAPAKTGRGLARFAVFLALLALLAVGAALWFGYQYWQSIKNDLSLLDAQLRQTTNQDQALQATISEAAIRVSEQQRTVETQAGKLDQTFERQRSALQRQQSALEQQALDLADQKLRQDERESQIRAAVADLYRRIGSSDTGWIAAEAEYLLRLADQRLRLANDLDTARTALEQADQRLRATGDPRWTGVRDRIARKISELDGVALPDITGLSAKLGALIAAVPELRLSGEITGARPAKAAAETSQSARDRPAPAAVEDESKWRSAVGDLWQGLKTSVRIHRHDQPVRAMPPAKHREFFYQNLELNLESARLALISASDKRYRESLANSLETLAQYFDPDHTATRAMRSSLESLAAAEIRPALPDLSGPLRALQAEQALQRSTLEVPAASRPRPLSEPVPPSAPAEPSAAEAVETSP